MDEELSVVGGHFLSAREAARRNLGSPVASISLADLLFFREDLLSTNEYMSRMPLEKLLALLFDAQSQISSSQKRSYLQVPPLHTLAQMDEALRRVFEQWGLIGPAVLGYCSAGLCVRPDNRALCLGCPFLVPHYSNLRNALAWRKLLVLQAKLHDEQGHHIDAKQARQMIQYLDDNIAIMRVQIETRIDGGYLPFADTLPPPADEEGMRHE